MLSERKDAESSPGEGGASLDLTGAAAAWREHLAAYVNDAATNDWIFEEFTAATDAHPRLREHRAWVETNDYGFGYAAFHSMWLGIIADVGSRTGNVRALEIGVHKGQTISLWSLLERELAVPVHVSALSPFSGNQNRVPRWLHRLRYLLDPAYRRRAAVGNLHPRDDYLAFVRTIYERFGLDFDRIRVLQGLSTDNAMRAVVSRDTIDVLYIDGDHSFDVALADVEVYAPLVCPGGYVVVDDAGCDLPGTSFWKGFESVTAALTGLTTLGFENVFNVAHNRVFQRMA